MERRIPRYSVILTHNRPEMLTDTARAIAPQVDYLYVIDNASEPPVVSGDLFPLPCWFDVVHDPRQPPNLATLWNDSLDTIAEHAAAHSFDRYDVALLCDDLTIPEDWYDRVSRALRENNASAASGHKHWSPAQFIIKTQPDQDIMNRMAGEAFILPGEKGLRADERLKWWYLDDDVDWQARVADGMVIAPGPGVQNRLPNYWTVTKPELGSQAGLDAAAFEAKWGRPRW
jgi:hypothetical protein